MVTREELYEWVWSTPMVKVAEKLGVSGSYLARVCSVLRVPRPERGYWAKLAVGKAPKRPALPEPLPGDPIVWSRADALAAPVRPNPRQTPTIRTQRPARPVVGIHGLIRDAKVHFLAGRKVDDDVHLKPYKKLLVDITATRSGLDKALDFANDLFNALESAGHRVVIAPSDALFRREFIDDKEVPQKKESRYDPYGGNRHWSPYRPTVVYVNSVVFGLAVIEMTESVEMRYVNGKYIRDSDHVPPKASKHYFDRTWTTTKNMPSGRLRLVVYSPYRSISWLCTYQETKTRILKQDLAQIVKAIEAEVAPAVDRLREAERQAEIWQLERLAQEERRRQEEDQRRIAISVKESRDQLEQVIQSWSKVIRLEEFFRGVEDRAQVLPASEGRDVLERLQLARDFVGTQEPLDFFRGWKTPLERYVPLSKRPAVTPSDRGDADEKCG